MHNIHNTLFPAGQRLEGGETFSPFFLFAETAFNKDTDIGPMEKFFVTFNNNLVLVPDLQLAPDLKKNQLFILFNIRARVWEHYS